MQTRRNFLKSFGIGVAGFIAVRRMAWTKDTADMVAANETVKYVPAIKREVQLSRYYNP